MTKNLVLTRFYISKNSNTNMNAPSENFSTEPINKSGDKWKDIPETDALILKPA